MPRAPPRWAGHCVRWHNPAACAFVCAPTLAHCPAHHPSIPPQHTTPALCPLAHPCVQVGSEVRGNNTAADADGTAAKPFVFPYPYTSAATLWFKVTVVVGTTRSDASELSSAGVVVGECAGCCASLLARREADAGRCGVLQGNCCAACQLCQDHGFYFDLSPCLYAGTPAIPRLSSPLGGKDAATFSITAVPTAVKYIVTASKDGAALSPGRQGPPQPDPASPPVMTADSRCRISTG